MKNLLLFGPLLWLRRVILILLAILIFLGLLLFFAANSPLAIKKAVDTYATDYNISYDAIEGNAISGIGFINPRYDNKKLANKIQLKWNPNTLAAKVVTVNKLHIEEGNVDVIKGLIDSFTGDNNNSKEDNSSSFDFIINAKDINISLVPFVQNNISISRSTLSSDSLRLDEEGLSVKNLAFDVESNMTNISIKGSMENRVVTLNEVRLEDINISALLGLLPKDNNSSEESKDNKRKKSENIYIPKIVNIEKLYTNVLAFEYNPLHIKKMELKASDINFDVEKLLLKDAKLVFSGTTNLSNIHYVGNAHNNHLLGKINLTPNNKLYELYAIPLRKEAIEVIEVNIDASEKKVIADIKASGKQILQTNKAKDNKAFNLDIDSLSSHVEYVIKSGKLSAKTKAKITTPYAKDILLTNQLNLDDNLAYLGTAKAKTLIGIDAKFAKPLNNVNIEYRGDAKSIYANLTTQALQGSFDSKDFKTAKVHLETKDTLVLADIVTLPKELQDAKVNVVVDAPLDLSDFSNIDATVKLDSNVVNARANVRYGKDITIIGKIDMPKNSLLKAYSPELKWEELNNIDTKVVIAKESLGITLKADALNVDVDYGLNTGSVKGKINLDGFVTAINGNTNETLKINTKLKSMKSLSKSIKTFYPIEDLPPIEGDIDATVRVDKLKSASLKISAPKLIYKVDKNTKHIIKDVSLVAKMDKDKLTIDSYKGTFNNQKYYSSKQARITLGDTIEVSNLWINDTLLITGNYNKQAQKGQFIADAKRFHVKDKIADIQTQIYLTISLDRNDTSIIGKVGLLEGKLIPNLQGGKSFASDSDIIIIQEMKKTKQSPFMDNLTLAVQIETKEALRLKQGGMNVRLKPDFTINKEKGTELLYLGSVELVKGSTYIFQEKRFVLDKSLVYFTGDVNKPSLDIKANYKSLNHLITIAITGAPTAPNLKFSSSPSLSKEQILSVILFDTEAGGDTQSGNEMMKMMGGAMAKAALSDVGVQVDHLAFGEGNSVEVGKKLNRRTTVIYINGEVPKVKLKYQHNKRTESVIGVSEESQSIDIIYKRDF